MNRSCPPESQCQALLPTVFGQKRKCTLPRCTYFRQRWYCKYHARQAMQPGRVLRNRSKQQAVA